MVATPVFLRDYLSLAGSLRRTEVSSFLLIPQGPQSELDGSPSSRAQADSRPLRCLPDSQTPENTEGTSQPVTVVSGSTESIQVVEVLLVVSIITEPTWIRLVIALDTCKDGVCKGNGGI